MAFTRAPRILALACAALVVSLGSTKDSDAYARGKKKINQEPQEIDVSAFGGVSKTRRGSGGGADSSVTVGDSDNAKYIRSAEAKLSGMVRDRLEGLLEGTFTDECRQKVTSKFAEVYGKMINEDWLNYETTGWQTECDKNRSPRASAAPKVAPDIKLTYLLLVHEQPYQIRRLIETLDYPGRTSFVIHVDGKESSQDTYADLADFAAAKSNVFMMETGRTNISWGGFNIVHATLNGLAKIVDLKLDYDWVINLSGYTYPLVSNLEIREELARFPGDTNFMEIRPKPNVPQSRAWHQFVECDNKMRRIYRMLPPRNIEM